MDTTKDTFNLAIKNYQEGRLDVAQELYNQVLKINPNHSQALNNIAVIFTNLKNYQKAKECYQKAIAINPNFADAHNNLGVIFEKEEEIQKAKECYEKVIEISPNHVSAHNNLGIIFTKLGEHQKAINCYEKIIEIDPNYAEAYNNLQINFFRLKEFKNSYNNHVKFLQLKSDGITSNAKLENVIPKFVKKLHSQDGVPTFFDNAVKFHLINGKNSNSDFCEVFEKGQLSKENRFVSYSSRVKNISKSTSINLLDPSGFPFLSSQGVHSLIKWKEIPMYKTAFDLVIYSMLLQEIKPDIIIELGSGSGGSAIWLADTASMLGFDTHVYSFDINKPSIKHDNVTFIEQDLEKINLQNKPTHWEFFNKKKIIIEDAHVNLQELLNLFDTILRKDDYLIIEDSVQKQDIISHFSIEKEPKYKLDQFFLDFFGTNVTCCINSIFKCY
jgi:cephalosporin hydroxylase/Tfp pilus assembly protein PilF